MIVGSDMGERFRRAVESLRCRDWGLDLALLAGTIALALTVIQPGQAQTVAHLEQIQQLTCKLSGGIAADLRGDRIGLKRTADEARLVFSRIEVTKRYALLESDGAQVPVRAQMTAEGLTLFRATDAGEIEITTIFNKANPVGRGLMAVHSVHGTQQRTGPSQSFGVCWEPG